MSQTKKSLQDLTLLDRFLFAEVMEDAETFENVLSIILGQDISIKGHPQSEHEKRTSPLKRQVRLDVWAEGLAEGRAEGLAEGDYFRLIQQIKKKIEKSKNLIQIADELEETPENIESLYHCIKDHFTLENKDIYKLYKDCN